MYTYIVIHVNGKKYGHAYIYMYIYPKSKYMHPHTFMLIYSYKCTYIKDLEIELNLSWVKRVKRVLITESKVNICIHINMYIYI